MYPDEPKFHVLEGRIHLETHHLENALQFMNALTVLRQSRSERAQG